MCVPPCLQAWIPKMTQQQPNAHFLSQQIILEYQSSAVLAFLQVTTQQLKDMPPIFRKVADLLASEDHQMEYN